MTMPLTQKHNMPTLRFPDFTSSYNEFRCGELFNNSRAKGWDGLPIFSVTMDRGLVRRDSLDREITADAAPEKNLKISKGNLAYNMMRMWQGAVGLVSEDGMVSPAYVVLSPKAPINSEYFYQSLYRRRSIYLLWAYSYGLTNDRLRLYFKDFSKIICSVPAKNEQKRIASFLSKIDTKIEQLGKKKHLLEQYKKGMMQKLFSQTLRFKDEQGNEYPDWEEKMVGEVLKIGSGKDYKHLDVGDIPVYGTGGHMTSVNSYLYDGESVCIGRKGTIDKPMYLQGKFWTVDTLFYTHSFKSTVPRFIYSIFQTMNWKKYNEASGVPSLSKKTIEKIKIKLPSKQEQQKIADVLSAIDEKIELIATELKLAKTFKMGLLQQMFV